MDILLVEDDLFLSNLPGNAKIHEIEAELTLNASYACIIRSCR